MRTLFLYALDRQTAFWLLVKRPSVSCVRYVVADEASWVVRALKSRLPAEPIHFGVAPQAYFEREKALYALVEQWWALPEVQRATRSLFEPFDLDPSRLATALKKHLLYLLQEDVTIITLANTLSTEMDREIWVKEYGVLNACGVCCLKPILAWGRVIRETTAMGSCLLRGLLAWCRPPRRRPLSSGSIRFAFEPGYSYRGAPNPEFEAFYRYFKARRDVLYVCASRLSPIAASLRAEGQPTIARRDIALHGVGPLRRYLAFCGRVVRSRLRSSAVKKACAALYLNALYYHALFAAVRPRYYLSVRSNFLPSHAIATAVAGQYGVQHIGYMCGSHSYHNPFVAHMDFHHFGLLGRCFQREMFRSYWPEDGRIAYHVLGPFMVEWDGHTSFTEREPGLHVTLITTTTNQHMWMSDEFYRQFVEFTCYALAECAASALHLRIREKEEDSQRQQLIEKVCRRHRLNYTISYANPPRSSEARSLAADLEAADLVIVMNYSTAGWEALSKRKKLLIVEQAWMPHPFEAYLPQLVARTPEQIKASLSWLLAMSQQDYERAITPVLEHCAKASDGRLVEAFIEAIEHTGSHAENSSCRQA